MKLKNLIKKPKTKKELVVALRIAYILCFVFLLESGVILYFFYNETQKPKVYGLNPELIEGLKGVVFFPDNHIFLQNNISSDDISYASYSDGYILVNGQDIYSDSFTFAQILCHELLHNYYRNVLNESQKTLIDNFFFVHQNYYENLNKNMNSPTEMYAYINMYNLSRCFS